MRKVKLVFHVGMPKTATTYLQEKVKDINEVFYLGKDNKNRKKMFYGSMQPIHSKLFENYRAEVDAGFPNPTKNHYKLITKYSEEIIKAIKEKKNTKTFVLSDECIVDYGNYLGELNLMLIIGIGEYISRKMSNDIKLKNIISITIRNQPSMIMSLFSMKLPIRISFKEYVKRNLGDPKRGAWGAFFYSELCHFYKSILKSNWKLVMTPFELLDIDGDEIGYIKRVFDIETRESLKKIKLKNYINVNSSGSGKNRINYNNRYTIAGRVGFIFFYGSRVVANKLLKEKRFLKRTYYSLLHRLGYYLLLLDRLLKKLGFSKAKELHVSEDSINLIVKLYNEDNINLKKELPEFDWHRYGYLEK